MASAKYKLGYYVKGGSTALKVQKDGCDVLSAARALLGLKDFKCGSTASLRRHVHTIFGKIKVIVSLRAGPHPPIIAIKKINPHSLIQYYLYNPS